MTITPDSFQGNSGTMVINGEIDIIDAITLTLSINPSDTGMMRKEMMSKYNNQMKVSITELVEFEDLNNDGFDSNDLIISRFNLNQENLNQVKVQTISGVTSFIIESKETNIFSMTVVVDKYEETPFAFKWSYDIEFPFASDNSSLAILHSFEEKTQTMMGRMSNGPMGNIHEGMMSDNHEFLPMVFTWDDFAIIDDIDTDINSSILDGDFILSFPFGNKILYDPKIELDPQDISAIDNTLTNIVRQNLSMMKPQIKPIFISFIGISIILTTGLILDRRTRVLF